MTAPLDIAEGRRRYEASLAEDRDWPVNAYHLATWLQTNAPAVFAELERGRQWEAIARRLAAEVDWLSSGGTDLQGNAAKALVAFRALADGAAETAADGES